MCKPLVNRINVPKIVKLSKNEYFDFDALSFYMHNKSEAFQKIVQLLTLATNCKIFRINAFLFSKSTGISQKLLHYVLRCMGSKDILRIINFNEHYYIYTIEWHRDLIRRKSKKIKSSIALEVID